jgi:plastocyanin
MTKSTKQKTMTVSAVAITAVLIGLFISPQLVTNDVNNVETANEPYLDDFLNSPILASNSNDDFPLRFIAPGSLKLLPEAAADDDDDEIDCDDSNVHCVTFVADRDSLLLPTGDVITFQSFDGQYPSPTIRVTQGDILQVTIEVASGTHSLDHHAAQISAVPNFHAVASGDSRTYTFVAANAGVFVYHCEANNVFGLDSHALSGMNGMLIVDPEDGYEELEIDAIVPQGLDINTETDEQEFDDEPAREFSLVYAEWYLRDELSGSGAHRYDKSKMFSNDPTYTHVNGIPFGYLGPLLALPPWTGLLNPVLDPDVSGRNLDDVIPGEFLVDCSFEGEGGLLEAAFCDDADGDGQVENNPPLLAVLLLGEDELLGSPSLEDVIGIAPFGTGSIVTQLNAEKGDHVRFFIQNNGDRQVPWHIVGEQLDRVTVGNNILAHGVQTWNIAPYSDATIDVVFEQPGVYALVNHDYSSLFKGQASIMVVHDPDIDVAGGDCDGLEGNDLVICLVVGGPAGDNPSNAVPPESQLEDTSLEQSTCNYGIGSETPNVFTSRCLPF